MLRRCVAYSYIFFFRCGSILTDAGTLWTWVCSGFIRGHTKTNMCWMDMTMRTA